MRVIDSKPADQIVKEIVKTGVEKERAILERYENKKPLSDKQRLELVSILQSHSKLDEAFEQMDFLLKRYPIDFWDNMPGMADILKDQRRMEEALDIAIACKAHAEFYKIAADSMFKELESMLNNKMESSSE